MKIAKVEKLFTETGMKFITPVEELVNKLKSIKALIFDWDGVFHSGYKNETGTSSFSEADSMGVNILRFAYYLVNQSIPYTAIITGENNPTAFYWAEREHLNDVFFKVKDKVKILDWLKKNRGIEPHEVLFAFDDILDLSLAKECGVRVLVRRDSSKMLQQYCIENKICDVITANDGGNHAVREISELIIALLGKWNQVVDERVQFDGLYKPYIQQRQEIHTSRFSFANGIVEFVPN